MSDIEFIGGLIAKAPNEKAPDFVKARLSIKREEMIAWLQGKSGEWINADIKEARSGKWYCAVDSWSKESAAQSKPTPKQAAPVDSFDDDLEDLPF